MVAAVAAGEALQCSVNVGAGLAGRAAGGRAGGRFVVWGQCPGGRVAEVHESFAGLLPASACPPRLLSGPPLKDSRRFAPASG